MPSDFNSLKSNISVILCPKLMQIYERQSDEGRASILGFMHLVDAKSKVKVQLRILRSGRTTLIMEANPKIAD